MELRKEWSPLPSLLTFEKDKIRRKVNVTLLFSWDQGRKRPIQGFDCSKFDEGAGGLGRRSP